MTSMPTEGTMDMVWRRKTTSDLVHQLGRVPLLVTTE
jgi:hypothetical protein